ncbi:MAG TPA: helicase-exonuclease AddAB subunit AddA [Clostridiales bacterium]|nr:helicase-exonuclease AddAB subunit AddA [Clostridiales bacterium]
MNYTADQLKAIQIRGCNVLVSAAAGSGKTGVLTERIIDRLRDGENIDELLVLTFTRAAAGEMKKRVRDKIIAAGEAAPGAQKAFWSKQLTLTGDASITTIHSFCLKLLRRHYNLLPGLDPKFRINDEKRAGLMQRDILEAYLEECYTAADAENRERVFELLRLYGSRLGDEGLKNEILRLMEFGCAQGDPGLWLQASLKKFGDLDFWHDLALVAATADLDMLIVSTRADIAFLAGCGGLTTYGETLREDLENLEELKRADWESLGNAAPFQRLKAKKKDDDPELAAYIKSRREIRKKYFADVLQPLFFRSFQTYAAEISLIFPAMETLTQLTETFFQRYSVAKLKKATLDFSDLELYTARLLKENPALAREYQDFFHEVLVDEYQDVNPLQEEIITLLAGEHKLFVVGDIKQSIYGFRLADHTLFQRRYRSYGRETANENGQLIFLNQNFRSRKEILDATNLIFSRLMNETVSQLSYGADEALKYGACYSEDQGGVDVEMTVIAKPAENQDESAADYENLACHGRFIAERIEKLFKEGFTVQAKNGPRPLRYGDITVLMRAANSNGEILGAELENRGIPVTTPSKAGFLAGRETKLLMSFLSVLDNPLQDIPLAAVLRSPLFHFSEDELMALSFQRGKKKLWEMVLEAETLCREGLDQEKVAAFRETLLLWRGCAKIYPVGDLVDMFLKEFDYLSFWSGLPKGQRRMKNVGLFAEEAMAFQKDDGGGLFDFLRYLEHLAANHGDLPAEEEGTEDCVRVMNIHKSKGLEFPVVVLAQTEKRFNKQDLTGPLVLNGNWGFGPNRKDLQRRVVSPTLPKLLIKNKKDRADLAEEMRVLYVALTRARDKLIITATESASEKKTAEEKVAALAEPLLFDGEKTLPGEMLMKDSSYYKWLIHAIAGKQGEACLTFNVTQALPPAATVARQRQRTLLPAKDIALLLRVMEGKKTVAVPAKVSVTSLLPPGPGEDGQVRLNRPKFMGSSTALSGAEKGTAFHRFMERLPFDQVWNREELTSYRDRLTETAVLSLAEAEALDIDAVCAFLESPYGEELRTAVEIRRELSFVGGFDVAELFPESSGGQRQKVILQGAVDLLYQKDNGLWVLLDYKTNDLSRYGTEAFLAKYGRQMELYRAALKRIYDIDVAKAAFYLTKAKRFL